MERFKIFTHGYESVHGNQLRETLDLEDFVLMKLLLKNT
jgi:hypothetical protein